MSNNTIRKVTNGYVDQTFDLDTGKCISQEFVAGDSDFENMDGDPLDSSEYTQLYFTFDMEQPTSKPLWIAIINHNDGTNIYPCESLELAEDAIYAYVLNWWTARMSGPMSLDKKKAVEAYFRENGFSEDREIIIATPANSFEEIFATMTKKSSEEILSQALRNGEFDTFLVELGDYLKKSLPQLETPEDYAAGEVVTYEFLGELRELGPDPMDKQMTEFMFHAKRTVTDEDNSTSSKEADVRISIFVSDDEEDKAPLSTILDWDTLQAQLELYLGD